MLCARVVRGISSTEKEVTPLSAISWMASRDPSGRRKPISIRRGRGRQIVLAGPIVRAVAEHLDDDVGGGEYPSRGGTIFAPFSV